MGRLRYDDFLLGCGSEIDDARERDERGNPC
jgi:hypothetical protein